jgi:hypothetical protein
MNDGLDTMTLTFLNESLLEGRSMQELEVTRWVIRIRRGYHGLHMNLLTLWRTFSISF